MGLVVVGLDFFTIPSSTGDGGTGTRGVATIGDGVTGSTKGGLTGF